MDGDRVLRTSILLDAECWNALAALARVHATEHGGRPSQSAVVRELIRRATEEREQKLAAS